jgi:hypothetical protein
MFRNPIGTHRAPFIVVTFQPNFIKIIKPPILSNFFDWQMAVKVKDRLAGSVVVVKILGGSTLQQEVIVNKGHVELVRNALQNAQAM